MLSLAAAGCAAGDDGAGSSPAPADASAPASADATQDDTASAQDDTASAEATQDDTASTDATQDGTAAEATSAGIDVTGTWRDSYGTTELVQNGNTVSGTYGNGTVVGELVGETLEGLFMQPGESTCAERDGSTNWGTITWTFDAAALSFDGEWAWCGSTSTQGWSGVLVDGAALAPVPIGSGLPASTRYGYVSVTLDAVGVAPAVGTATPVSEPLEDDEVALVFDVTIDNLNPETGWELPHGGLFWGEVDGDLYPATSETWIELEPGRDETASIVVPIPDRIDPTSVRLWIQEAALDADLRRKPAFITVDGSVDSPFEELVTATFENGAPDPTCGGTYVYERWVLDDDAGFKENGAPVSPPSQLRGSGVPILGRAAEGELYLTTFAQATRDTSTCALQVWRINPFAVVDGVPVGPVTSDAVTVHSWTEAPTDDIWTFPVPDTLRNITVENADSTFQAAPWTSSGTFEG
ncbi:MAG: hypothetical protein AAGA37_14865 [Actinomycetota bacterium]